MLVVVLAALLLAGCVGSTGATGAATAPPATKAAPAKSARPPGAATPAPPAPPARTAATAVPATSAPAANFDPSGLVIVLAPLYENLERPVFLTHAGDGSGDLYIVEQPGRIRFVSDGRLRAEPFLDIESVVGSRGNEQGLLSLAFHPNYVDNGYFYVNYTENNGATRIERYTAGGDRSVVDAASAKLVLGFRQPFPNHNGGMLLFGPDGMLWIGTGDGGSRGDPQRRAQNPEELLGKMLRIDVDGGDPYSIPPDNPFASGGGRPEIWSMGLRNPWRFSFDRTTGDLFISDVGQSSREEVNFVVAGSPPLLNFGWKVMEASSCYQAPSCDRSGFELPVAEYGHDEGCSITGGYVYRGQRFPDLVGGYFFADFCSGLIWSLSNEDGSWRMTELLRSGAQISSFGEDEAGELYVLDLGGTVYRLTAAN